MAKMEEFDKGNVIEYHGKLFFQGRIKSEYGNSLVGDDPKTVIREVAKVLKDREVAERIMKILSSSK